MAAWEFNLKWIQMTRFLMGCYLALTVIFLIIASPRKKARDFALFTLR